MDGSGISNDVKPNSSTFRWALPTRRPSVGNARMSNGSAWRWLIAKRKLKRRTRRRVKIVAVNIR
jgi:hypothetical protein